MNHHKYKKFPPIAEMQNRTWPDNTLDVAPTWCSVDLRDGNQALPVPMGLEQKLEFFQLLVKCGFKEIEVGFPAASKVEFDFVRKLIEDGLIPKDVHIQVLTQAREHLVEKTCKSLVGAKKATIHLYNSTSELQRRVVFKMDRAQVLSMAVQGTKLVKKYAKKYLQKSDITFEYSPESFMGTELDYAAEVCEAVSRAWGASREQKIIINLPSTVEVATPNIWADQIEWFCKNFKSRDRAVISVHCHNDRGTGVAATELALLAGAERVEGTLFGNGERTGNVDLVILALNLLTQGIDPRLDFSRLRDMRALYERCTGLTVHPRHPYSGELVFTAFSGSHQDAIRKGMHALAEKGTREQFWEVPYLPIDPKDIGREYEPIIRINSQSGKGGAAFVLEQEFGYRLPKAMHPEFGTLVQAAAEKTGAELPTQAIWQIFADEYLSEHGPFELVDYTLHTGPRVMIDATLRKGDRVHEVSGFGNGPIAAFAAALRSAGAHMKVTDYEEHALAKGADAKAVAYVQVVCADGRTFYGVSVDPNIVTASLKAVLAAHNRAVSTVGMAPLRLSKAH